MINNLMLFGIALNVIALIAGFLANRLDIIYFVVPFLITMTILYLLIKYEDYKEITSLNATREM